MKKFLSCGFLKQLYQHILRTLTLCFSTLAIFAGFEAMTPVFGQTDVNIILLHHSTGGNLYAEGEVEAWFANYNSTHGTNYQITERWYPASPYPGGENYPYDYWHLWVDSAFNDLGRESLDYLTQETGDHPRYDVIIFKHCFPGSDILPDTGSPNIASDRKSLENYQLQYRALCEKFAEYPDTKFIVWTLAPLHRLATDATTAARAKQFADWVKNTWLSECGHDHSNISIFDFGATRLGAIPVHQKERSIHCAISMNAAITIRILTPICWLIKPLGRFSEFVVQMITGNRSICSGRSNGHTSYYCRAVKSAQPSMASLKALKPAAEFQRALQRQLLL